MFIMEMNFIKDFMKIIYDVWLKGWYECNGGNIMYRLIFEEIFGIKEFIIEEIEYILIGVIVENLVNEYFLVIGSGKFMRNIFINIV